ncbi:MAG: GNAT family N-acetyltransferase [Chloroflexota bacterium]
MIEQKLTIRHYEPEDYPEMVELSDAANRAIGDPGGPTVEQLQAYFSAPDFDRLNDSFLIERAGKIVGVSDLEFSAASGRAHAAGSVHPDANHQGIGTRLIHLTEARALGRAETELRADQALSIDRNTSEENAAAIHLFEAQGYRLIRTYYRMRIDLDAPIDPLPLPDGLELRPFDPARHAEAVYAAFQESFADHWGFEPHSYEDWAHYNLNPDELDPPMWQVAWDQASDQIAGICLNRFQNETVWVVTLGVRRPWRKRGLGLALLKSSFALFQTRGYQNAELGVDAASLTNAVALYERAGMHVHKRWMTYHKLLRGTVEA